MYRERAPPTDVDDVPMFVDHDVAIVSVLDLQEVAHQRIGRHASHKVGSCLGEREGEREGERL